MLEEDQFTDENVGWPGYVDFLCTFVFILILFIGSLLFLLSGDIRQRAINRKITPVEAKLKAADIRVDRQGDKLIIPLEGRVEFGTNSADIMPEHFRFLRELSGHLTSHDVQRIMIRGLADSQRCISDPFCNWDLSARRAEAVLKFFYNCKDCGYGKEVRGKLILLGEGDTSSEHDGNPHSAERRVDIILDFNDKR